MTQTHRSEAPRDARRSRPFSPAGLAALALGAAVLGAFGPSDAQARITRIEIKRVEQPTFEGRSFGTVGAYEKLVGRAFGEVDPNDPRNAVIVDIAHAPKNARGMVEYDMDFMILKPVDLAKGNHRLWFEVNNRGSLGAFQQYNDARSRRRQQSDHGRQMPATASSCARATPSPPPAGTFRPRRATAASPSACRSRSMPTARRSSDRRWKSSSSTTTAPSPAGSTIRAASLDKSQATLTVRTRYEDEPAVVPADQWEFVDQTGKAHPPRAGQDAVRAGHALHLHLPGEEPAGRRARLRRAARLQFVPALRRARRRRHRQSARRRRQAHLHLLPLAAVPHHARLRLARLQRGRSRPAGGRRASRTGSADRPASS